jgi:hypothetical protein
MCSEDTDWIVLAENRFWYERNLLSEYVAWSVLLVVVVGRGENEQM